MRDEFAADRAGARFPRVVVLGGGPAGVGAAFQLARLGRAHVTLVEAQDFPGGNSGSFEHAGQRLDYGSHRLHPACDPAILRDIHALLGDRLVDRPRHGRIRLRGRWIHFPLKPLDLVLRLDPAFALGTLLDATVRRGKARAGGSESFASVLERSLGRTICRDFYFPYARKIWGLDPHELSAIQARRRVAAGSFAKLARKVLSAVPGFRPPGAGRFYYPRGGFGEISEAYAAAAGKAGANLMFGWRVIAATRDGCAWNVCVERAGETRTLQADHVWSTLPLTLLARMTEPRPPGPVLDAAMAIEYRAMLLIYLTFPVHRFSEFDAHYFPDGAIRITRLSEPKNYAAVEEPIGRTTVCAELPCRPDDSTWRMTEPELARLVLDDLRAAGLDVAAEPVATHVRRLRFAYPVYRRGYEDPFGELDRWAAGQPGLLTFGRQGLFAHDNTHHALRMAYAAADCLGDGGFDSARWAEYRAEFERHVVED